MKPWNQNHVLGSLLRYILILPSSISEQDTICAAMAQIVQAVEFDDGKFEGRGSVNDPKFAFRA